MAAFCTQCGAPLAEGLKFCTGCGAAVTAPPHVPARGVPPRAAAPRPAPPRPAPATKSPALKIVLIVVAVFVVLGLLAGGAIFYGMWRVARTVHVDPRKGEVTIKTPEGAVTVGKAGPVTEADVGAPIYPGATAAEAGVQMASSEGTLKTYVFKTADPAEQVIEFYRRQLGEETGFIQSPEGAVARFERDQRSYVVTVTQDPADKMTVITMNVVTGEGK